MEEAAFDPQRYGLLLRSARHLAGFQKASEFAAELSRRLGSPEREFNKDSIYRIERGLQVMPYDAHRMMLHILNPPRGEHWFDGAWRSDIRHEGEK